MKGQEIEFGQFQNIHTPGKKVIKHMVNFLVQEQPKAAADKQEY